MLAYRSRRHRDVAPGRRRGLPIRPYLHARIPRITAAEQLPQTIIILLIGARRQRFICNLKSHDPKFPQPIERETTGVRIAITLTEGKCEECVTTAITLTNSKGRRILPFRSHPCANFLHWWSYTGDGWRAQLGPRHGETFSRGVYYKAFGRYVIVV